ncbi:hypothetical protein HJFPF1_11922 [Paramyrothecium foliicola]|nr:hypothetical protein HJFPF1_11922 [Paramyrothecium foliicola]
MRGSLLAGIALSQLLALGYTCEQAVFVKRQPVEIICSGSTTSTTTEWTYTDCEPKTRAPFGGHKLFNAEDSECEPGSECHDTPKTKGGGKTVTNKVPNTASPRKTHKGKGKVVVSQTTSRRATGKTTSAAARTTKGSHRSRSSSSNNTRTPPTSDPITGRSRSTSRPSGSSRSSSRLTGTSSQSGRSSSRSTSSTASRTSQLARTSQSPSTSSAATPPPSQSTSSSPPASPTPSSTTTSPVASPTCADLPNGDFGDGTQAPWYISDQVTADSSTVVAQGVAGHPYSFALIPSQTSFAQVYLNNYLPRCGDPPPLVTLMVSFEYQFTGASQGCTIQVSTNRSPDNIVSITDNGSQAGVWQTYQGGPVEVQLTYDPLFTVKLACQNNQPGVPAILITAISAY